MIVVETDIEVGAKFDRVCRDIVQEVNSVKVVRTCVKKRGRKVKVSLSLSNSDISSGLSV